MLEHELPFSASQAERKSWSPMEEQLLPSSLAWQ